MSKNDFELKDCHCCKDLTLFTPVEIENPPGLSSIRYRVGSHSKFKASMIASLSKDPVLRKLTSRADGDLAIGLLDAWATVADVLTFYQERIANEGFLRTATERRSILELARAVGYELRSGVAASTFLAFSLDDAPGAVGKTIIDAGTSVQSLPGQGEMPQVFETNERIEARPEWNKLKPRTAKQQSVDEETNRFYFKGTNTRLKPGDGLLVVECQQDVRKPVAFKKISKVEIDGDLQQTIVEVLEDSKPLDDVSVVEQSAKKKFDITEIITSLERARSKGEKEEEEYLRPEDVSPEQAKRVLDFLNSARTPEEIAEAVEFPLERDVGVKVAQRILDERDRLGRFTDLEQIDDVQQVGPERFTEIVRALGEPARHKREIIRSDLIASALKLGLQLDEFIRYVNSLREKIIGETNNEVYMFRVRTGLFGHNAPRFDTLPGNVLGVYKNWDDPLATINRNSKGDLYDEGKAIYLDNSYPAVLPDSWTVLESSARSEGKKEEEEYLRPEDVSPEQAKRVLDFLNSARTPEEIAEAVEFPFERDVGVKVAQNILKKRDKGFKDLKQVDEVWHVGPERFTEIVRALGEPSRHRRICAYWINGTREKTLADFLLSAKVTGLSLDVSKGKLFKFPLRETTVYAQSEKLELAELRDEEPVEGDSVTLNSLVDGLQEGQPVAITGELVDKSGITRSEIAIMSGIKHLLDPFPCTRLFFTLNLSNKYKRDTVTLNANVARASHGETKEEVLGGGDPSQRQQEFMLKQKPLTFISAATARGAQSTLKIRVDDVLWKESPNLYNLIPDEKSYVIRIEDDGRTRVIFGDGIRGARPQAGIENIQAKYRVGIGKSGMLKADQLSLLMSRPLGVRSVTNPTETTGAADPEDRDHARIDAPLTVLTMERIVSLKDFENFALGFEGIGKAKAIRTLEGEKRVAQLTVATVDGKQVEGTSELYKNLVKQIGASKDPSIPIRFKPFNHKEFNVEGKIMIAKDMEPDAVKLAVNAALQDKFSFEKREFGQAVTLSEIIASIQHVKGVVMADIDYLYDSSEKDRKGRSDLIPKEITDIFAINREGVTLEVRTL